MFNASLCMFYCTLRCGCLYVKGDLILHIKVCLQVLWGTSDVA